MKKLNKISRCGILMSEIEAHHKERLHVALKRSGFFTTVCTVSTFVILRKHKSAARSTTATKENTLRVTEFPSVQFTATSGRLWFSASLCFDSK